jgi:hypothetical protein
MYPHRQTVDTEGAFCKGVLAPQPPEGGAFDLQLCYQKLGI